MSILLKKTDPAKFDTPALILFLFEDDKSTLTNRPELKPFKTMISKRLKAGDFSGKALSTLVLFLHPGGPERVILVGLGKKADCKYETLRAAAAKGVRTARAHKLESAAMLLPPAEDDALAETAEGAALGAALGLYNFEELKSSDPDEKKPFKSVTILHDVTKGLAAFKKAVESAGVIAGSVGLARDLINRPANMIYPESLAAEAKKVAKETAGLTATVITMAQAEKRGMGAFIGVAQGSRRPGNIIVMKYNGGRKGAKPVVLIGKAITFDSGGLSLKPPQSMVTMKTDMSGGAAVLAAMKAAAELQLKTNVVGIIPAAENMPDGNAYRPGDVLKSMSGQTIEIISTDAEGRLVLADGLTLAQEYKPKAIIDLATLTGAAVVALGEKCAAVLSNNDELSSNVQAAGKAVGEMIWPLPLIDEYFEQLKSETADFKNSGGRSAGSIVGGLFLQKFVDDKTPWAHVDIAGPARMEKDAPDTPAGGAGFGVQFLVKYLRDQ